jgi:hypothetical protein
VRETIKKNEMAPPKVSLRVAFFFFFFLNSFNKISISPFFFFFTSPMQEVFYKFKESF